MEAKRGGLSRYDMNGLLNDGISDFKRSFAQHTDTLVGSITASVGATRASLQQIKALELVSRKPILPSKEELESNNRAHSAKLRVARKIHK